ncbi:MAG: asparagine synthase (glutamine-hydrolyzing) [Anaerolineae bacterium]|nr:MAG: asparagine synthase (glutamine-hydrolyzing) [Anaerolineae bacterium]
MCGICGIYFLDRRPVSTAIVEKMSEQLKLRGPDGEGVWVDGSVGLGHKRLAIVDLTPSGRQPMSNKSGDIVITYNGELYNHPSLRVELEAAGYQYHSRSDTETIIHAYEEWGIKCLDHFNGMFAFALWDKRSSTLFLARDRFGVKPLYYYSDGRKFIFSSEIKAILAVPEVERSVNYHALNEYFTFQNVLTDLTLFDGVKILPAGHYLTVNAFSGQVSRPQMYWDFNFSSPIKIDFDEAVEEVYRLFNQAVARQLMSDVPIASYLSGGMDSGSITAVARKHLGRIMTFTGGFDLSSATGMELGFDERTEAENLSNLLKTEHYEMVLHAGDMEHIMPELIWHLEDLRVGQCYPNYYIARLASKFSKVVLSGAGGDELFAGYPWRYYLGINSDNADEYFRNYYNFWQRLIPDEDKVLLFQDSTYRQIVDHSTFDVFCEVIKQADLSLQTSADRLNASLYFELKTFLHGLLVVEDKVSMSHSLESRVPFLDNDLVDFACSISPIYKLRDIDRVNKHLDENDVAKYHYSDSPTGNGKLVLRKAMARLVPDDVTQRVKQGFSAPDASWFRGESIDYVNRLLNNRHTRIYEYLNHAYVSNKIMEHSTGKSNNRLFIWSLLSFEWWLRKFFD